MAETQFFRASPKLTVCEKLREINDMHQGSSEHDINVRIKLGEAQLMAKKMSGKLLDYNIDAFKDFWERNSDYEKDLRKRIDKDYLGHRGEKAEYKELRLFAEKINSLEGQGKYIAEEFISIPKGLPYRSNIVEVGSWLGQIASYLCLGMNKYGRQDLNLSCFDEWRATKQIMKEIDGIKKLKLNQDLLENFNFNTAPFGITINTYKSKISFLKWKGPEIELFIFHSGILKKDAKKIFKVFSPWFIPGETTIFWVDYYKKSESDVSWKKKMFEKSTALNFVKKIKRSKVAVFKYEKGKMIYD